MTQIKVHEFEARSNLTEVVTQQKSTSDLPGCLTFFRQTLQLLRHALL